MGFQQFFTLIARDPLPFMANAILNFHFSNPSLNSLGGNREVERGVLISITYKVDTPQF